jgi:di/tricarboxylate transporter
LTLTTDQALVFAILSAALALFMWNRWRYDLVALLALLTGVLTGVVPPDRALLGFANPSVVTVAAVLVLSGAISRSGIIDVVLRPISRRIDSPAAQIVALGGLCALLSGFMNNVGALAVMLPVAIQVARRSERSPATLLMPLAFASLLGGLVTLIGTPPNILISAVRREIAGTPFGMFDFTPVGLPLALAGIAFLAVGWRLLPRGRAPGSGDDQPFRIEDYVAELVLPEGSSTVGKTVADIEAATDEVFRVLAIERSELRHHAPSRGWRLRANDRLVVEAEPRMIEKLVSKFGLELQGGSDAERQQDGDKVATVEAIVTPDSRLVGTTAATLHLRHRHHVNLLAVTRRARRPTLRLKGIVFQPGDVLMLQGEADTLSETLASLGLLPLAARDIKIGRKHSLWLPAASVGVAATATALGLLPPAIAFLGAAAFLLLLGLIGPDEAYASVSWPVIVLLGALIPVSDALRTTGATDLVAGWLSAVTAGLSPLGALAMMMLATMLITPVLNNAATVLVMAPIAASYAARLGLEVDPFLMAVAIGASCDFLTPIGHQSNTLVLTPGGYRFVDYPRLGLPLSLLALLLGTGLVALVWPLTR